MTADSDYPDIKFIVDHNVGKLTKLLRMLGYDAVFFNGESDSEMVAKALNEGRIILTRDTGISARRAVTDGKVKIILLKTDNPALQIQEVVHELRLSERSKPFTRCLECNVPLEERTREEVEARVPPYVFKTQKHFMECPRCHRIYWKGTHWQAMERKLDNLKGN